MLRDGTSGDGSGGECSVACQGVPDYVGDHVTERERQCERLHRTLARSRRIARSAEADALASVRMREPHRVDEPPGTAKRSIPKALKRHVLHRDGYKCRVPGCRATTNIDCHHIFFLMYGGTNTYANLIALCEGHHLALHDGSLVIEGDALSPRFIHRAQNNFKRATRAVECAAALRKRGVDKKLIKAAVDATRTHVGKQDLTLDQWVEIALTKLPPEARES
jgi:hypothetical protein